MKKRWTKRMQKKMDAAFGYWIPGSPSGRDPMRDVMVLFNGSIAGAPA